MQPYRGTSSEFLGKICISRLSDQGKGQDHRRKEQDKQAYTDIRRWSAFDYMATLF